MSLANLSIAYEQMRSALESVAFEPGEWPENKNIHYCRWCNYSRDWIAKYRHQGDCPLASSAVTSTPSQT